MSRAWKSSARFLPRIQSMTMFSIGVGSRAGNPASARALSLYLTSAKAAEAIQRHDMEPVVAGAAPDAGIVN